MNRTLMLAERPLCGDPFTMVKLAEDWQLFPQEFHQQSFGRTAGLKVMRFFDSPTRRTRMNPLVHRLRSH